jgi:hypothetical protein
MSPLPDAIIRVLPPFAPGFSHRVWLHAQRLFLGAVLRAAPHTASASLRRMGLTTKHHFTHDRRVLTRAIRSARHGGRILSGLLIAFLVAPGAYGRGWVGDTVERHSGRKITAKGCYRETVHSSKAYAFHCFGLIRASTML